MTTTSGDSVPVDDVPGDVASRLLRALNRSPSMVITLVDADLRTRWISRSATWVTGTDPDSRAGRGSLERIHPDDVEPLLHALDQLRSVTPRGTPTVPVIEPLRYRVRSPDGEWITMESLVLNLLDDPEVDGLVLIGRPVANHADGTSKVVDLLVAEAPLPEVLAACARLVPDYLGRAAVVARVDGEVSVGAPAGEAERLVRDDRWWSEAMRQGRPLTPAAFEGFPADLAERARGEGFQSAWASPLLDPSSRQPVGCIVTWVWYGVERNVATDEGLRQAERLARLVIDEERRHQTLRAQAVTDPLTGLGNRAALARRLASAGDEVTVAVIDLDQFKPINDRYGHDTGDLMLQLVARRLAGTVRDGDLAVRFGGDEFAVVFAGGTSQEGAEVSARRIVEAIEAPARLGTDTTLSVGASVGVATAPADQVLHRADEALYRAKRAELRPGT